MTNGAKEKCHDGHCGHERHQGNIKRDKDGAPSNKDEKK